MENYLQFGSGFCAPEEWLNFDASPTLLIEKIPVIGSRIKINKIRFPRNVRYGDIVKGLPLPENSCKAIYCSHVIEHLAMNEIGKALCNIYRLLKPDGIFRMVLPDLEYFIRAYIDFPSPLAADKFMRESGLGLEVRSRSIGTFFHQWFGHSQHLWMWDFNSLGNELYNHGFKNIRRAAFRDSPDPMFTLVEEPSRWQNCLGIECSK